MITNRNLDDAVIFVGIRVSDLPVPLVPSNKLACEMCEEPIWADKTLLPQAFSADEVLCTRCGMKVINLGHEMMVNNRKNRREYFE